MDGLIDLRSRAEEQPVIDIGPNGLALDFFQAIYRNSSLSLHIRMRAARDAIAYESAKLMAVAVSGEKGFAAMLEERLRRRAKLIEAKPVAKTEEGPKPTTDLTLPPPIPDRRFRRRV